MPYSAGYAALHWKRMDLPCMQTATLEPLLERVRHLAHHRVAYLRAYDGVREMSSYGASRPSGFRQILAVSSDQTEFISQLISTGYHSFLLMPIIGQDAWDKCGYLSPVNWWRGK